MEIKRITINKIRKPQEANLNKDLLWFSDSLGLFTERDKERSCFRIFVELVKTTRKRKPINSDELAFKTHLTRGTVIHHLNKLMESGLVISYNNKYFLRTENFESLVNELKKDMQRIFEDLKEMAEELDENLGLIKRKGKGKVIE